MPMLIDFGAARSAIAQQSQTISAIVKEGYSPPEQYTSNANQTAATDVYALGAVFYRMITGNKSTNASLRQMALLKGDADPIGNLVENYKSKYSQNLLEAVMKALDIHQERRFQSISEFQKAISTGVPIIKGEGNKGNGTEKGSNKGVIVGLLAALLLAVVVVVPYIAKKNPSSPTNSGNLISEEKIEQEEKYRKQKEELEALKAERETRRKQELQKKKEKKIKLENKKMSNISLQEFVKNFVTSGEDNNINNALQYFSPNVSPYFNINNANKNDIYRDKSAYNNKWPQRKYDFLKFKIIDQYYRADAEYWDIVVTMNWKVTSSLKELSGKSAIAITIKKLGNFQITSIKSIKKYIRKDIQDITPVEPDVEALSINTNTHRKYRVINVAGWDTLNVRKEPYVGSNNKVGELHPYTQNIRVLKRKRNHNGTSWSKIEYNKGSYILKGWVVSRCLKKQ